MRVTHERGMSGRAVHPEAGEDDGEVVKVRGARGDDGGGEHADPPVT